jgi:hypothetical protein
VDFFIFLFFYSFHIFKLQEPVSPNLSNITITLPHSSLLNLLEMRKSDESETRKCFLDTIYTHFENSIFFRLSPSSLPAVGSPMEIYITCPNFIYLSTFFSPFLILKMTNNRYVYRFTHSATFASWHSHCTGRRGKTESV